MKEQDHDRTHQVAVLYNLHLAETILFNVALNQPLTEEDQLILRLIGVTMNEEVKLEALRYSLSHLPLN